jgi:uncharacterized repeat protein (TIGR03809 family)
MVPKLAATPPPINPAKPFEQIALRWSNLADRRVAYYTELFLSGRWKHYFTEQELLQRMLDVKKSAVEWDELARNMAPKRSGAGLGVRL